MPSLPVLPPTPASSDGALSSPPRPSQGSSSPSSSKGSSRSYTPRAKAEMLADILAITEGSRRLNRDFVYHQTQWEKGGERITELETQVEEKDALIKSLQDQLEELEEKTNASDTTIQEKDAEIQRLQDQLDEKTDASDTIVQEKDDEIQRLQADYDSLKTEKDSLKTENDELATSLERMDTRYSLVLERLIETTAVVTGYTGAALAVVSQYQELHDKFAAYNNEHAPELQKHQERKEKERKEKERDEKDRKETERKEMVRKEKERQGSAHRTPSVTPSAGSGRGAKRASSSERADKAKRR